MKISIFRPNRAETRFQGANKWIDNLQFHVLLHDISIISGRWEDDKERLCAIEILQPPAGFEPIA